MGGTRGRENEGTGKGRGEDQGKEGKAKEELAKAEGRPWRYMSPDTLGQRWRGRENKGHVGIDGSNIEAKRRVRLNNDPQDALKGPPLAGGQVRGSDWRNQTK